MRNPSAVGSTGGYRRMWGDLVWNSRIVAAHDSSRVDYDKQNSRVEIWIEEMEVSGL